jgi:hypothetical protein
MISETIQNALETGGYVVEYWAEVFDRNGTKTATVEMESGTINAVWMDPVRRTVEMFVPLSGADGNGGLKPELDLVEARRLFGDDLYGDHLYGYKLEYREIVTGILKPFENTIVVYATFTFNGIVETTDLGKFTINSVTFKENETGFVARVSGWDSGGDIALQRFVEPISIGASTNITPAIYFILEDYLPQGVTMSIGTISGDTTPKLDYLPGDSRNPWEAAREVAMSAGSLIVANRAGNIIDEVIPQGPEDFPEPVWSLNDATIVSRQNYSPDASQVVNKVIVVGENPSSDPVVAIADDLNGQFGSITTGVVIAKEHIADNASTSAQCLNIGIALLRKHGQLSDAFEFTCALNPELEPGQTITVTSVGLGMSNTEMVVEEITYPLKPTEFMTLSCTRTGGE